MIRIIALTFLLIAEVVNAGSSSWQPTSVPKSPEDKMLLNLPYWVVEIARASKLESSHSIDLKQNPYYLTADFNGDGLLDVAVRVIEKSSEKLGIAVFFNKTTSYHLLGAGRKIGSGSDNFSWVDMWSVESKARLPKTYWVKKPPIPAGDTLEVARWGSSSAAIYWNGKSFVWHQIGD